MTRATRRAAILNAMKMREFYADAERAGSEEVDLGSSWRTQGEGPWKVVWLEATGELAAFDQTGDEVVVVGFAEDADELQAMLAGWEAHAAEDNGLAWLVDRCDNESADGESEDE
jgi:hypothetical protein